jgi:hypothetical protein
MTRIQLSMLLLALGVFAALPALGANEQAVLVLHAIPSDGRLSCSSPLISNFDCNSPATVSIGAAETIDAVLFLYEYDEVAGVQCLFDWPADWIFQGWRSGCASNQVYGVVPTSDAERQLATAFDVISRTSGATPIGWMAFVTGSGGCLSIGESTYPFGTHVIDGPSSGNATAIPTERRGSICAGGTGIDGCSLGRNMTKSTWGAIKDGYDR